MADPCPACETGRDFGLVEEHFDPIGRRRYRVLQCGGCGVVFSEPREAVGADWYEKASPIRGRERRAPPEADWRFNKFLAERLPPGRLLDVGCGDGGFMLLARDRGYSVAGVDYDARVVSQARARGLAEADAGDLWEWLKARPAAAFDFATLFDVLEHTPEPARFLAEVRRLLKPGAHLALTLPNAHRPLPWGREEHDYPPHHFTRWTPKAMRTFLEGHGFKVVRQDSELLKLRYLADHFYFFVVMPALLRLARLVLFGRAEGTISELYAGAEAPLSSGKAAPPTGDAGRAPALGLRARLRGALKDKLHRQRAADLLKAFLSPASYGLAAVLVVYYQVRQVECGDCLYTLARLEGRRP